jgi:peptidyl-prolyl cis-trans isomerase B (cyclophilin B)
VASSKDRERELARRRLERRQLREAQQRAARRRAMLTIAGTVVAVLAVIGVVALVTGGGDDKKPSAASPSASSGTSVVDGCTTPATPPTPAKQTYAKEPPLTVAKATYTMAMQTNCGQIELSLDAAKAPHTVNSLKFLADKGYYNNTKCHRLTTGEGLQVLQCGDPAGDGTGGPGYTLAEENLTGATYKRGTVAMAKTSAPHSTGSQFFLVIKDSQLPPQYTPVGTISKGLDILDKILAAGVSGGGSDGPPAQPVYLLKVTVSKAS